MVGAVIMAAGAGRRMGGRPKALLELDGMTFLERVVRTCRESGCTELWAVSRPGTPEIAQLALSLDVQPVPNLDPARGMFSSVVVGLDAALEGESALDGFVLFPVDHPLVRSRTVAQIMEGLAEKPDGTWVRPQYEGRSGHPIAVDREAARALRDVEPTRTLLEALLGCGLVPFTVEVDDQYVLENLNTPEDLKPSSGSDDRHG